VLTTLGADACEPRLIEAWRDNVQRLRSALGWPQEAPCARPHRGGMTLAFNAPVDQLFSATEVNEWAWQAARGIAEMYAPGHAAANDADSALHTLRLHAAAERRADLVALLDEAARRRVPILLDDEILTLGSGRGGQSWSLATLPEPGSVPWSGLHGIPTALVTGSNGKTTTVRLVASMLQAHGLRTAHSCTDGVFFEGRALQAGDWSGPAGARSVLREAQVEAAVLETARGGLLRRGLAVHHANAAIVTNISADHFGEYGIDDLDGLTETKLIVARALDADGVLVLNADDAQLRAHAASIDCRLAWFALDDDHALLREHRARDGATCGIRDGRLRLSHGTRHSDLGAVESMPLSAGGLARYNIANIAGAVLLANALAIDADTIAAVLARFGAQPSDNPGRLQQWNLGDVRVLLDYAHNPAGLQGLLSIARGMNPHGRLGLILGQAGNRGDDEIRALAASAAQFAPDLVVLKDMEGYLRGRAEGEVATVLRAELIARGLAPQMLPTRQRELDAARVALAWARPGDVVVLPVHALKAKAEVGALLDRLQESAWMAGEPLPDG
jgi:UDP-N-acetylmuramyl tripeptide synthase